MIMICHLSLLQEVIAHILEVVYAISVVCIISLTWKWTPHLGSTPCKRKNSYNRNNMYILPILLLIKVVAFLCGFKIFEEKRKTKVLGELHSPIFSALI